ncbi:MAG: 3-deoxy-8-phosphooctulonate synthase [Ignavibacteriales bacterium CG_4_9_14_3_um_filter_34_10]|nr:MAG: 3-deoxy-8-phosphooctulonate synthase [Ignavibacteriales bacterium CG_4_9_14_3_um_filter_34_10]
MKIHLNNITIGGQTPFVLIAGPCVVENREITFETADAIKNICTKLNIDLIFKSSFKKANRTSLNSFTTIGVEEALKILDDIKKKFNLPIITDVHSAEDIRIAKEVADILQIPAFLSRQSDLLYAAGESGKIVNIKKGQFLSPEDMKFVAEKVEATGNKNIMLTERGTTFGYHNLVVDMRSLVIMKNLGYPVVMDATHSVQMPSNSNVTGGQPEFIFPLAKAAAAVGIDALFLEVHPNPEKALSDAGSQLKLDRLEKILITIKKIDEISKMS